MGAFPSIHQSNLNIDYIMGGKIKQWRPEGQKPKNRVNNGERNQGEEDGKGTIKKEGILKI